MTIPSLSSSTSLNSLLASSTSSTSSTSSKYSQLQSVVDDAIAAGDGTALSLYQSFVTLSNAASSAESTSSTDTTTSATYTAKGLLNAINSAQLENNPLLSGSDTTSSSVFGTSSDNSTLSALYQQIQDSGNS
jgi:hypothetical protein